MSVTAVSRFTPRTLEGVHDAARIAGLEPEWTASNTEVIFDCPQCVAIDHRTARASARLVVGVVAARCALCEDGVEPGILGLLGETLEPRNNVVSIKTERNGHGPTPAVTQSMGTQPWRSFEQTAGDDVPCIIKDLWPEGALGFIGAAPKAGKTWIGLDIGVSVVTGTPVFGSFTVPKALPVLYVALEGHRAAIRTRVGCITRGHGANPEGADLDNLHLSYKPKGINLHDPGWAAALCEDAIGLGVRMVVVDVLRRAAQIKENDASSFMELVDRLNPISEQGVSLGMLHHFNKVNENTTLRTPAERMAGSGAMFGAFDVGLFITKSENGARKLTIHTDIRDLAAPEAFVVTLQGDGTGAYGGFTYRDSLRLIREDMPEPEVKGAPLAIRSFVIESSGQATPKQIRDHFGITDATLRERRDDLEKIGVHYINEGKNSRYECAYALPRTTPQSSGAGSHEHTFPADQISVDLGVQNEAPRTPHPYGDAGDAGSRGALANRGVSSDEVQLDQDDDAGYWNMLSSLGDPHEEEPPPPKETK